MAYLNEVKKKVKKIYTCVCIYTQNTCIHIHKGGDEKIKVQWLIQNTWNALKYGKNKMPITFPDCSFS